MDYRWVGFCVLEGALCDLVNYTNGMTIKLVIRRHIGSFDHYTVQNLAYFQ